MRRYLPSPWAVIIIGCWLLMVFSIYRVLYPAPIPYSSQGITLPNTRLTEVQGPEGHKSISIVVDGQPGQIQLLPFSELAQWNYDAEKPTGAPLSIQWRHGKKTSMVGFMFPLTEGETVSAFCLMATTQTCCYGPKPQFNQFALVECRQPVYFERMRPVLVTGDFFVEPRPQDGYIFRIEADNVQPIGQQLYANVKIASSTPVLDWFWFTALQSQQRTDARTPEEYFSRINLPDELLALADKEVVVQGFQAGAFRFVTGESGVIVSKDFWDGCCTGVPPTPFNSVPVVIASGTPQPEVWSQNVRFVGVLRIRSRQEWPHRGLMALEEAKLVNDS